jgi:hypothetical protein
MTVNDLVKKLRVMLAADKDVVTETKMASAELVDGTIVETDGEMEIGSTLYIQVEEGEERPFAPEAIHETTDGMLIGVGPNGEIMEISEVEAEAKPEEIIEEVMEEVEVEVEVPEEAIPATEELLTGIAEIIAPFTEEIAALTEEVTELKAKFSKLADEPAAKPIRNEFSGNSVKRSITDKRMEALKALRNN